MKQTLLFIGLIILSNLAFSQSSDFIQIKKRNNRTVKTYYEGSFISAVTYSGFPINGYIKTIRNDSVIIRQEERTLMATDFGTELDTFVYLINIDYHQIKQFNFKKNYGWGGKKGFVQVAIPKILMLGGAGFIVIESVNTIYRRESFNDSGKLRALGIAAAAFAAGWLIEEIKERDKKIGKKYKVVYVKAKAT